MYLPLNIKLLSECTTGDNSTKKTYSISSQT
ncbi:hypothetical protein T03_1850 [Trichinella britovi]|uniref:Uncharacterized protein n=1 Tax=Trichinella britovi TaxID=45882 RepID=A0A0V0YSG7_TRIBR|nr:hypothetical protein T03_1850 [Trichinella britovi]